MPRFACMIAKGAAGGLYVYAIRDSCWSLQHLLPAEEPVVLTIHPARRILYVLHEVSEYKSLPRGYVSAYAIGPDYGECTFLGQQALSLSATLPRHLAISPSGRSLMVSVRGGGAYNLLSILEDGSIGRVLGIRKETGNGSNLNHEMSARPAASLFDESGKRIIAIDAANDTISLLHADPSLPVLARVALPRGTGAAAIAIHHASGTVLVAGALSGSLLAARYDAATGTFTSPATAVGDGVLGPLAVDPRRELVYALTHRGITAYRFDGREAVIPLHEVALEHRAVAVNDLICSRSLDAVCLATSRGVLRLAIDPFTGRLASQELVAAVPEVRSIGFL